MPIRTILRTNVGVWLALPLTLLAVVYIANFNFPGDPYAVAVTASGLATLGFVVPICAALGAWEGGRLRRGGSWSLPVVRSRYVVAAWALGPVVAAGWLSVSAGVFTSALASGVTVPDWRPLMVAFVVVVAQSAAGFAAGLRMPTSLAVAVSLFVSFAWMVFLRGLDPPWLRYLNGGALELCCGIADDIALGAITGPLAVAAGLFGTAALTISTSGGGMRHRALALGPLLIGLAVGGIFVSGLPSYPTAPRDERQLVCADVDGIRVCVWPEHAPRLAEVAEIASTATSGWRAAGVTAPTIFTEAQAGVPANALSFRFALQSSPAVIMNGFAYAMLPPWPACADSGPYPGYDAFDYVQAWYASRGGLPESEMRRIYGGDSIPGRPPVIELLDRVLAQSADAQRRWLAANVAALQSCELEPQLLTPSS